MTTRKLWTLAAIAALCGGCAAPVLPPAAPRATPIHAFVVLGPDGAAVARAITTAAACPAIEIDGVARPMSLRAPAATIALRPTISPPAESKPSSFPVSTCELTIPPGATRAAIDGRTLPLPKGAPRTIVVIGDTGCRTSNAARVFQACNDPAAWPFAAVAAAAAAFKPDLVIHVGDYHYRENACPAGNAGCAGSPWGYGWDAWEADFFAPARPLLAAAPWIAVRGNHESCFRAGQGWWRFLDPRPVSAKQDCNDAADDTIGDFSEPYAVPLGRSADAQFIVFDSSRVGVNALRPDDPMYVTYRAQLERAFALAASRPQTFFMNHHPILGFASNRASPDNPYPGNGALQSVLATLGSTALFPPTVQALLAGHFHIFEMVSFATSQPPQFIAGNGGDWLDPALPTPLPPGTTPAPNAVVAALVATNRFGFMTITREGDGWRLTAHDVAGAMLTRCTLAGRKASCTPASLP